MQFWPKSQYFFFFSHPLQSVCCCAHLGSSWTTYERPNDTFDLKSGADPAAGKGGGPTCWPITGVPGGWPPGGGPGGRAPLHREILNFWTQFARFGAYFLPTSYWKYLDLFPIKVFFVFMFVFFPFELWNRPI